MFCSFLHRRRPGPLDPLLRNRLKNDRTSRFEGCLFPDAHPCARPPKRTRTKRKEARQQLAQLDPSWGSEASYLAIVSIDQTRRHSPFLSCREVPRGVPRATRIVTRARFSVGRHELSLSGNHVGFTRAQHARQKVVISSGIDTPDTRW